MRRDFWAIMRLGQLFISKSNNSQNEAAAKKLVYGLADFLSPEDMENTVRMAGMLDFESSVASVPCPVASTKMSADRCTSVSVVYW